MTDAASRHRAECHLELQGFERTAAGCPPGAWKGFLDPERLWPCAVMLPVDFPADLPVVTVDETLLGGRRIPHVERSGKVCIARNTGVLLDDERPEALVQDALDRAFITVTKGLSGENTADFANEIRAYWAEATTATAYCSTDVCASVHAIMVGEIATKPGRPRRVLVTDSKETLTRLATSMETALKHQSLGIYVPLARALEPPVPGQPLRVAEMWRAISERLSDTNAALFDEELNKRGDSVLMVLGIPSPSHGTYSLVAAEFPAPVRQGHMRSRRRWLTRRVLLKHSQKRPVELFSVDRLDHDYLLKRTGGESSLQGRKVVLVGCGAVGGHIARMLCVNGVSHLTLVDQDVFSTENLYRHILGLRDIGRHKSTALKRFLDERYFNTEVSAHAVSVQTFSQTHPNVFRDADAIIFATGEESLERNFARASSGLQLHVWVEPLGVGGHVFVASPRARPGCIRCLYTRGDDGALYNRASFAEPGQEFVRTMAGCSNSFSPFTALDAERAAGEALRALEEQFRNPDPRPQLVSWLEAKTTFLGEGYRLSALGIDMREGERRTSYPQAGCPYCNQ